MADREITIAVQSSADTAGLDKAQAAVGRVTASNVTMGAGMGKAGMLANQASYQIGDFVTQVSMGTSASRAFAQQAPQLIGAFQMAGIATGGVGLALAGISVALPLVVQGFAALKQETMDVDAAMRGAADGGRDVAASLAEQRRRVEELAEAAEISAGAYEKLRAAQAKAAAAALADEEKLIDAREKLNSLLGVAEDLSAAKAANAAAQREEKAGGEIAAAASEAAAAYEQANRAQQRANALESQMERWREQLERVRTEQEVTREAIRETRDTFGDNKALLQPLTDRYAKQTALAAGLETELATMEKDLETATAKAGAAAKEAEVAGQAAEKEVERIRETLEADDTAARVGELDDFAERQAAFLNQTLDQVTPATAAAAETLQSLRTLTADGKLGADESRDLARNAGQLVGQLQTGVAATNANQRELIAALLKLVAEQERASQEIRAINQRIGSLPFKAR